MAIERERKFLVDAMKLPTAVLIGDFFEVESGYFTETGPAIRVTHRIGGKCKICLKSPGGETRQEFEYIIPEADALAMIKLSPTFLKKARFIFEGWEIDRIPLPSTVLWVAEWEEHEGKAPFPTQLPEWIIREVTGDHQYSMQALAWKYGRR